MFLKALFIIKLCSNCFRFQSLKSIGTDSVGTEISANVNLALVIINSNTRRRLEQKLNKNNTNWLDKAGVSALEIYHDLTLNFCDLLQSHFFSSSYLDSFDI